MSAVPDPFDYESAVEACARGEHFALRALYEREARRLLGVAQRIVRDRDVAHDVLQDAFLQVWLRAATYQRALGSARGWLYTVVRHRALDEARRIKRDVLTDADVDVLPDSGLAQFQVQPFPHADAQALHRCLETLDERRRNCIVSAFVEGYTHEQIAHRLAAPVGTVKSLIRRGLLALKECLS